MTETVLIVDDEDLIREVAATALEAIGGMAVLTASSGEAGLRAATEDRPDGILLDVMMPGMDGPSTLRALQSASETADIPVAFLTAKVGHTDRQALETLGAVAVISKPFDPLTLADEVRAAFGW